jgi:hypothetical protein
MHLLYESNLLPLNMKKLLSVAAFAVFFVYKAAAQTIVTAKNASKHIGQTVKICDNVFDGKLVTPANITLLDIGGNNPNQQLTLMIPAAYRNKFKGRPEVDYRGKDVIVTGKLIAYKGKPEIIITNPKQLKIVLIDNDFKPVVHIKDPVH